MAEILLVNPRKRKTARRKKPVARKKARSAAQKRATAKMVAANRRRRNPKRRSTKTVARRKPTKRRTTARRAPVRRRRTARRSNPALNMRSIQNQLVEAGTGAVGALGLGVIQGYLPIPANLKVGLVGTGIKALLAIGMGVVASKVKIVRGATANKMVNGALTVVLYDELKKQVQNFAPGIQMGEYLNDDGMGYYGSGLTAGVMGDDYGGMGSYLPEIQDMPMGMEQDGLGLYETEEYVEDMTY